MKDGHVSWSPSKHLGKKPTVNLVHMVQNDLSQYDISTTLRELLQNADDAGATAVAVHLLGRDPKLPEEVLVCNDSVFIEDESRDDVDRFREFHSRKKEDERQEIIGRFGIGRVACYHICDVPTVVTHRNGTDWLVLPLDLQQEGEISEVPAPEAYKPLAGHIRGGRLDTAVWKTIYYLKTRLAPSAVGTELKRPPLTHSTFAPILESLTEESLISFLLFLNHLTSVQVLREGAGEIRISKVARILDLPDPVEGVKAQQVSFLVNGDEFQRYLVLERDEEPEGFSGTLDDVRSWRRKIAFHLDGEVPQPVDEGRLYCYLPTAIKTGFPFHIHGSFHVKMDRGELSADPAHLEWNEQLLEELGYLFADGSESLRLLCERADRHLDFYKLFPIRSGAAAPKECQRLLEVVWEPEWLGSRVFLVDQDLDFHRAAEIKKVARPGLYSLFKRIDQPLLNWDLQTRYSEWLKRLETCCGPLGPFGAAEAINWLDERIQHGDSLAQMSGASDREHPGVVLCTRDAYFRLLDELRGCVNSLELLKGRKLGLAEDGGLWELDDGLVLGTEPGRQWLLHFERHLAAGGKQARPSSYFLDGELARRHGDWLKPVLGVLDTDFLLERLRELHSGAAEGEIFKAYELWSKDGPAAAASDLLKCVIQGRDKLTTEHLQGLVVTVTRQGTGVRTVLNRFMLWCEREHFPYMFNASVLGLLHPDMVTRLGDDLSRITWFARWDATYFVRGGESALPKTGQVPGPDLQPPFTSTANLRKFLALVGRTCGDNEELKCKLARMPIFLNEDGRFSPLRDADSGGQLFLPAEGSVPRLMDQLQQRFPSAALLHADLVKDHYVLQLAERLGAVRLTPWGYVEEYVVPHLPEFSRQPDAAVEILDVLRQLYSVEISEQKAEVLERLRNLKLVLAGGDFVRASDIYEPVPIVEQVLESTVGYLESAYLAPGPDLAERVTFLRELGLRGEPSVPDIISYVQRLAGLRVASPDNVKRSGIVLDYLSNRLKSPQAPGGNWKKALQPLRNLAWLAVHPKSPLDPGLLHPPLGLYQMRHFPLVGTQRACAREAVGAELAEVLGLHKGDPEVGVVLAHLLALRARAGDRRSSELLKDCMEVVRHLGGRRDLELHFDMLREEAIFPFLDGEVPYFRKVEHLLPTRESKRFGSYWPSYISPDDPRYELAHKLGMPDEATAEHFIKLIDSIQAKWKRQVSKTKPLPDDERRLFENALRVLANSEPSQDELNRLVRISSLLCTDHQFRKPGEVWIGDSRELEAAIPHGAVVGILHDIKDFRSLYKRLGVRRLSKSHSVTTVPVDVLRDVPPDLQGVSARWNSESKLAAYRRIWHHYAVEDEVDEQNLPDIFSLDLKLVEELGVRVVFERSDGETYELEEMPRDACYSEGRLLMCHGLSSSKAERALAGAVAEFLIQTLTDRTSSELSPTVALVLACEDSEVEELLNDHRIRPIPGTVAGIPVETEARSAPDAPSGVPGADEDGLKGDPEGDEDLDSKKKQQQDETAQLGEGSPPARPVQPGGTQAGPMVIPPSAGAPARKGGSSATGEGTGRAGAAQPPSPPMGEAGPPEIEAERPTSGSNDNPSTVPDLERELEAEVRRLMNLAPPRRKPASEATREEKEAFWDLARALQGEGLAEFDQEDGHPRLRPRRRGYRRSGASEEKTVFVREHWRRPPGSAATLEDLDDLWSSWEPSDEEPAFESASPPEIITPEEYLRRLWSALMFGHFLSEEQAARHAAAVETDLKGGAGAEGAIEHLLEKIRGGESGLHHHLAALVVRFGSAATAILAKNCQDQDALADLALQGLGVLQAEQWHVVPEHWLQLLPEERKRIVLLLLEEGSGMGQAQALLEGVLAKGGGRAWVLSELKHLDVIPEKVAAVVLDECSVQYSKGRLEESAYDGIATDLLLKTDPDDYTVVTSLDVACLSAGTLLLHSPSWKQELLGIVDGLRDKASAQEHVLARLLCTGWFLHGQGLDVEGIVDCLEHSLEAVLPVDHKELMEIWLEDHRDLLQILLPVPLPPVEVVLAWWERRRDSSPMVSPSLPR